MTPDNPSPSRAPARRAERTHPVPPSKRGAVAAASPRPSASRLVAGTAGALHATLPFVAAFLTAEVRQPSWTASPDAIVGFYRASTFDGRFITGAAVTPLAFVLLVFLL